MTAPGIEDLSTGAAGPVFAVLAVWIGALGLLTVFPSAPGVGGIAGALALLVLWTLVGLGLAVGATARARRIRVAALLRS